MRKIRVLVFSLMLTCCMAGQAFAEGFAMTEWGARGLALAGGMVGRADDVSTLAYNAAGITQLPGIHVMGGMSFIAPYGTIDAELGGGVSRTVNTKPAIWVAPHAYLSYQLNDNIWLGLGTFTRFGLGNTYDEDWLGRYNVYEVGLQTFSAVPTIAYKFNDMFSASIGIEFMYMSMYMGQKIDMTGGAAPSPATDLDLHLEGSGVGVGVHLGLHARFNEQWSAGISYKSQMTQSIKGDAQFSQQVPAFGLMDGGIHGTIQLPDSIAFGIAYKPLENLSFEVGAVWTRWSTFNHLNIFFDNPASPDGLSDKEWKDGWNFNASVEYSPLDWWTLRAGYWHETAVTNADYADFLMPTKGRDVMTLGMGFQWDNWTIDLAYAHIWVYPTNYDRTQANGINVGGNSKNVASDIYSFSIGYTF